MKLRDARFQRLSWLKLFLASALLLVVIVVLLQTNGGSSERIEVKGYETITNRTYAVLSVRKPRLTYAFSSNAGLPLQIEEFYWKYSSSGRESRALPNGTFWSETNGVAFAHVPLEDETGEYQLEYITTRRLWIRGTHVGPPFARRHFVSGLIPSVDRVAASVGNTKALP